MAVKTWKVEKFDFDPPRMNEPEYHCIVSGDKVFPEEVVRTMGTYEVYKWQYNVPGSTGFCVC